MLRYDVAIQKPTFPGKFSIARNTKRGMSAALIVFEKRLPSDLSLSWSFNLFILPRLAIYPVVNLYFLVVSFRYSQILEPKAIDLVSIHANASPIPRFHYNCESVYGSRSRKLKRSVGDYCKIFGDNPDIQIKQ
uniref:Uncharacterized protein n=1 Tax=Glossina austeni TaxID=7395 RepID=A0A1A9VED4_GLOAU